MNKQEIEKLTNQLIFADAVKAGMIGATPSKGNKNSRSYLKWYNSIITKIKKLNGQEIKNVWDKIDEKFKNRKKANV